MHRVFLGLGSNLGDRQGYINLAFKHLRKLPDTRYISASNLYETEPVGPIEQGKYLNAAVEIATDLTPQQLITELQAIEHHAGRGDVSSRQKWGPRTLDLDILLYADLILDESNLKIPHPHMHQRRFVLEPLAEIAPDAYHPILKKSVRQLLAEL